MDYETFTENVRLHVLPLLRPTQNARLKKILKNNGCTYTSLIIDTQDDPVAPAIYLEDYYSAFLEEREICAGDPVTDDDRLDAIAARIVDSLDHLAQPDLTEDYRDYETVKDRICVKLVSHAENETLIQNTPYVAFHDLCVLFFIHLEMPNKTFGSILLKEDQFAHWNLTPCQLYPIALANTMRIFPAELCALQSILQSYCGKDPDDAKDAHNRDLMDKICDFSGDPWKAPEHPMPHQSLILTNKNKYFGATTVLYPELLNRIGDALQGSYYLIPSSIHEMLILPSSIGISGSEINEMIHEINKTEVSAEEVLGTHCYYFDHKNYSLI